MPAPGRKVKAHRIFEQGGAEHAHDVEPEALLAKQQQRHRHPEIASVSRTHAQWNQAGTAISDHPLRQFQLDNTKNTGQPERRNGRKMTSGDSGAAITPENTTDGVTMYSMMPAICLPLASR
ncbi:hypothetical protein H1P_6430007 [Hyella patelloides LEGE 07179]|uniref:Uncharacterized protein n=1 Tax=Hyella patelloides LEGE 07179 TaxID=945734 RepID=A0A563W284_9CYAN|nr:hypothetical protein H1P_6430007 [Hyella patelloides LEGE 07179]